MFHHTFLVVKELDDELILGTDFFKSVGNSSVSWNEPGSKMKFILNSEEIPLHDMQGVGKLRTISTEQTDVPVFMQEMVDHACNNVAKEDRQRVRQFFTKWQKVFSAGKHDLGRTEVPFHTIKLEDARPFKIRPRRLGPVAEAEINEMVAEMEKAGIVVKCQSPWSSPALLVPKKDGSKRFCVDYRTLNQRTVKDSFPLPRIDDTLDKLGGSTFFSTMDLACGFWQIKLRVNDQLKTAFVTTRGQYMFVVLPFGLCNAPATFSRLMEVVMEGLPHTIAMSYLDDVIIAGKTVANMLDNLASVFERFAEIGLKFSPKKCQFFQRKAKFLGHVVSEKGVSTDPSKTETIAAWPTPKDLTDVNSFLGLTGYYRRFIPGYNDTAKPLNMLKEKHRKFVWGQDQERAFQKLKKDSVESLTLAYPNAKDPIILDTDASNYAAGATLSQVQEGEERPVAHYSRSFDKAAQKLCATQRELLAVVSAVKHFRPYLYGRRFLLRTDHSSLSWLHSFKDPPGKLARWLDVLSQFNYKIQHRPGRLHGNADALSRKACGRDCKRCQGLEAKYDHCPGVISDDVTDDADGPTEFRELTVRRLKLTENPQLSRAVLRDCQKADPELGNLRKLLSQHTQRPSFVEISQESPELKSYVKDWDRLVMEDGLVCRRFYEDTDGKTGTVQFLQILCPRKLRQEIIDSYHESPSGGHLNWRRTLANLHRTFHWHSKATDVKLRIQSCDKCLHRNRTKYPVKAPCKQRISGGPMERIALDILGPLPTAEGQIAYRFVLVVSDYFTKWVTAVPLPNHTAKSVAEALVVHFISYFGVPQELHTDQGKDFESQLFTELCELLGTKKTKTTIYHPQSDGMVERYNRVLGDMLAKFVSDHEKDWHEFLPFLCMAYRATPHSSTGMTPNLMMLGREVVLPVDLQCGAIPGATDKEQKSAYVERLRECLRDVHIEARKKLTAAAKSQARYYDRGKALTPFKVGDVVLMYNPVSKRGKSRKFRTYWDGPFVITHKLSELVYKISKGRRARSKLVHLNKLKSYNGRVVDAWFESVKTSASQEGNNDATEEERASNPNMTLPYEEADETLPYDEADDWGPAVSAEITTPADGEETIPYEEEDADASIFYDNDRTMFYGDL